MSLPESEISFARVEKSEVCALRYIVPNPEAPIADKFEVEEIQSAAPGRMVNGPPCSSSQLLDSTSDLIAALNLFGHDEIPNNKDMADLENDLVIEVPDSPDRVMMVHSSDWHSASTSGRRVRRTSSTSAVRRNDSERIRSQERLECETDMVVEVPDSPDGLVMAGSVDEGGSSTALNDTEHMHRQAGLKRLISKTLYSKPQCCKSAKTSVSHPSQCRGSWGMSGIGLSLSTDHLKLEHRDEGKQVRLTTDSQIKSEQELPKLPQLDVFQSKMDRGQLESSDHNSHCNTTESNIEAKVDGRSNLEPFAGFRDQDNREHVDMHGHGWYPKGDNNVAESNAGKTSDACPDEDLPELITIISSDSEVNPVDKKKGKLKMDDATTHDMQCEKSKSRPGRDIIVIVDADDSSISSKDIEKEPSHSSHEIFGAFKGEDTNIHLSGSPEISVSPVELNTSTSQASSESESESRRRCRRQKLMKGKREYNFLHSISGESSSSVFEDSEMSYRQSSGRHPNSHHGTISGPVIEVDDLISPEGRIDDSSAIARQVESDEILARRLQEQFCHESTGSRGTEETDATIAWSLQEEEAARHAVAIARIGQSNPRDASMAHLYRHYPQSSFQDAPAQLTNRARVAASRIESQPRRNINFPEVDCSEVDLEARMLAHLRRNFNSGEMDEEMIVNVREALEAAFDINNDMFQIQHDSDEDDYEMLSALDDDNNELLGASEGQIDSLPRSVIQTDGNDEVCVVCLDIPSAGDVVRHLPCLHRFHRECIDHWLRRRATCPICKSSIS